MAKITGNLTGTHSISVELTPKKTLSGSISSGGGKVKSVNGMIGDVVLTANDIYNGAKTVAECLEEKAGILEDTVSGSIVSFTPDKTVENLKGVQVDINPVQDLHGYDNPWPAGGNTNKWDEEWEIGSYSSTGQKVPTQGGRIRSVNKIPVSPSTSYYALKGVYILCQYDENEEFISFTQLGTDSPSNVGHSFTTGASTHYITFATYANYGATYSHDIAVNYPSSVTTYSPYSNICPISGWDECKVMRAGVNLWDEEWEVGGIRYDTGLDQTDNNNIRSKNYIAVVPQTTYYMKCDKVGIVCGYDSNKNFVKNLKYSAGNATFTTSADNIRYIRFCTAPLNGVNYGRTYNHDISINYPSSDHSYHPYQGNLYTISLGQTVYGGRLDVINGSGSADMAMIDLGDLPWQKSSSGAGRFYAAISAPIYKMATNTRMLCSDYAFDGRGTYDGGYYGASGTFRYFYLAQSTTRELYICDETKDSLTAAQFKTAMVGVKVCFELATPIEISLTPTQISSLKSLTTMYADTGNISVDYAADLKTYILNAISNAL